MAEPEMDSGSLSIADFASKHAGLLTAPSAAEVEDIAPEAEVLNLNSPEPTPEGDPAETEQETEGEPEAEQEAADEAPEAFEVEIDGEKLTLTKDEVVKGYLRQSDYTKKTQELSGERQKIEQGFLQYEQQMADQLARLEQFFASGYQENNLTPQQWQELRQTDPEQYLLKREEMLERETQINAARAERETRQRQAMLLQLRNLTQLRGQNDAKLADRIPEWKDPAAKDRLQTQLSGYLQESGFSPAEIDGVYDSRTVEVAYKAMKWDELQKSKPLVVKKVSQAPKLVRPGAGVEKGAAANVAAEQARKQLRSTGSVDAYAAILRNRMK